MSVTAGLIGRPGSGAKTLYELVTGRRPDDSYIKAGVKAQIATVHVPDARLDALSLVFKPRKTTPAQFELMYLPGFSAKDDRKLVSAALSNYRNSQVFIRNALHVPPAPEAVRDCMPALMELIANEAHAGVRAVLGHFVFVFIHPYMDGNGRLGRFLMNYLLATGGYTWTIVTVQSRNEYLTALEQASTYGNVEPFANLITRLLREQTVAPVERGSQRPYALVV